MTVPGVPRPERLTAAFALVAALLACALLGSVSSAQARALTTGITNTYETSPLSFDQVKATGASYVKMPIDWNSTVPTPQPQSWNPEDPSDPNYNWDQWDEQVNNAVQAGLTPVLQVGGAPQWAQRCVTPSVFPWATCDPSPADLRAFVVAAARHYSGSTPGVAAVHYWQILNEPNLTNFFFPQYSSSGQALSATLYRPLINAAYSGLKSVSASNLVILGGLGPIAVAKYTIGPMRFARELLCMTGRHKPHKAKGSCEGGVHFDIFATQPYTTGSPTHEGGPDDVELGDLPKLEELIKAADKAHRIKGQYKHTPLWITEFSWDTKPPDPGGLQMKIADRWVPEALYFAWKNHVANFFWYSLHDEEPAAGQTYKATYQSGLYYGTSSTQSEPKPILTGFRFPFVAYPGKGGLSFWGRTPNGKPGKVKVQLQHGKSFKTIKTVRADKSGIFQGTLKSSYGADKSGAVRAVLAGSISLPFSMRPVHDFYHPPFG